MTEVVGEEAGGLIGLKAGMGDVVHCYAAGKVEAGGSWGGLIREAAFHHPFKNPIDDCYWDVEATGKTHEGPGTGKMTSEMMTAATFEALWGCSGAWTIDEGNEYPRLAWEGAVGEIIGPPSYGGGDGDPNGEPFMIYTAEQLNTIGVVECQKDRYFMLGADIDLEGVENFNIIGSSKAPFRGIFDGGGHTISNLQVRGSHLGLFGSVVGKGATIRNVGMVDFTVNPMGGGGDYVGGLVGHLWLGTIEECFARDGVISGRKCVGGLVGKLREGRVEDSCVQFGVVEGDGSVGGLVGNNHSGVVSGCYSTSSVRDSGVYSGGLGGYSSGGDVSNSFWDVDSSGMLESAGGTGVSIDEMLEIETYLDAGWDFAGEEENGTDDTWRMEEMSYPRLWWQEEAGPDIVRHHGDIDGFAGEDCADLVMLGGAWLSYAGAWSWNEKCDLDDDGHVGVGDFAMLADGGRQLRVME